MAPRASATAHRNRRRRATPPLKLGFHEIIAFVATRDADRANWTSPSGARVVWFKDPDGNTLSITQF